MSALLLLLVGLAWMLFGFPRLAAQTEPGGVDDPSAIRGAPIVLYTDITSGPNTGGENDKGAYLSIFGKNFGRDGLGTKVKVTLNGVEVDNYRYLGASHGRADIQQITVQIGHRGDPRPGTPLPIAVSVNGVVSNADHTFVVNPGRILFVDNVRGDDASAAPDDISRPFRHVQLRDLSQGAYGQAQAGDVIVLRGRGQPWTDVGFERYFLRFRDKSGSEPRGQAGTGPIAVMGYPGEDVYIKAAYGTHDGGISAINGQTYAGLGQWVSVSNLRIEGGGDDGAVNLQIHGNHWRVVNNELTAETASTTAKAGGIAGNGLNVVLFGNHIHDVHGNGQENHGIYIDGNGSYDVAFNRIERIFGGNGFQIYVNGSNGSDVADNVNLHHNLIRGTNKHGINIADNARGGIVISNNVVSDTRFSGLRFNSTLLRDCRVYNNTFYRTDLSGMPLYGALTNDWTLGARAVDIENNIFVPSPGTPFAGGTVGFGGPIGVVLRNVWWRERWQVRDWRSVLASTLRRLRRSDPDDLDFDAAPIKTDPGFRLAGVDFRLRPESPAIDAGSSAVAPVVQNDFDLETRRPQGGGFDVGAYEFVVR
ncbi:choice-of-anchor Q domain-containing protein [Aquabacterium sp.]|uniref:choice-of-anchor Q domain-containing protein n=1 Tax=Aquabacterium sp. TaxID=1872578 RepID=UPI0035B26BD6